MKPRSGLICGGLASVALVAIGSLTPFAYQAMPMDEALQHFAEAQRQPISFERRSDWGANLMLGVPLGFFWLGSVAYGRGRGGAIAWATVVLPFVVAFSIAVEFAQIWFPERVTSINDVYAQAAGSLIGAAVWLTGGEASARWWTGRFTSPRESERLLSVLLIFAVALIAYDLTPMDLTLSPAEIYRKARDGRVVLVPFSHNYGSATELSWAMLRDVTLAIPIGVLASLLMDRARWNKFRPILLSVAFFALIEIVQLLVISRFTDTTDVVTGAAGGALGVWLAASVFGRRVVSGCSDCDIWLAAACVYATLLLILYWYPYNFDYDKKFVLDRLAAIDLSVGGGLYWSSELNLVSLVLTKLLTLGVLGALLAMWVDGELSSPMRWTLTALMLSSCTLLGGVIEAGQLLLPSHISSISDIILYACGAFVGFFVTVHLRLPRRRANA